MDLYFVWEIPFKIRLPSFKVSNDRFFLSMDAIEENIEAHVYTGS
jgi:hypothetical protein